ncbi:hypothetical protein OEZ85_006874 [Tetradesmus obliquus]|uniref:Uncharacterized protein n=1 Tax=Tetradesmus obliquus TaxID=3088 RepID=A0ABY8TVY9_TETOB|nr:hypothetical protein OEZ85_006874 [Tetradesmus obliquus]
MQAATVQEQYVEAARLWDESLAWLEGWHKPITAGSPASSLLHVGRQHGRWIARWFTIDDFLTANEEYGDGSMPPSSSSSSQVLNMRKLVQDSCYGTPLFETYILPAARIHADAESPHSSVIADSKPSSSYTSLTASLQSVAAAMDDLLRTAPASDDSSSSSSTEQLAGELSLNDDLVHVHDQRTMLLVDAASNALMAAAVPACEGTLLVWRMQLDAGTPAQQPGMKSWPGRPGECGNGAIKAVSSHDGFEHLLRGPGSIQRTGPGSFAFLDLRLVFGQ